jgi:hypothetical protein
LTGERQVKNPTLTALLARAGTWKQGWPRSLALGQPQPQRTRKRARRPRPRSRLIGGASSTFRCGG